MGFEGKVHVEGETPFPADREVLSGCFELHLKSAQQRAGCVWYYEYFGPPSNCRFRKALFRTTDLSPGPVVLGECFCRFVAWHVVSHDVGGAARVSHKKGPGLGQAPCKCASAKTSVCGVHSIEGVRAGVYFVRGALYEYLYVRSIIPYTVRYLCRELWYE